MGIKLELNKKQKKEALLNTAFDLFTTKGIHKTSISDIVNNAGVAKGTFYLYFTDKFDIRNKLISHKAYQIVKSAYDALMLEDISGFENQMIFMIEYIIDTLESNPALLNIISKHLSWGIFKTTISSPQDEHENILELYQELLEHSEHHFKDPEIMIFSIIEYVSGICYNTILYKQPVSLTTIKPYLFDTVRQMIPLYYIE